MQEDIFLFPDRTSVWIWIALLAQLPQTALFTTAICIAISEAPTTMPTSTQPWQLADRFSPEEEVPFMTTAREEFIGCKILIFSLRLDRVQRHRSITVGQQIRRQFSTVSEAQVVSFISAFRLKR